MQKSNYQFVLAETLQDSLMSLLKDKIKSEAIVCINSSELVHIIIAPLEMRVKKVPNVLSGHCVSST